ncbi:unnamed protein product [Phaeothamnion confervicola]
MSSGLMLPPPPDPARAKRRARAERVVLLYSPRYESLCNLVAAHRSRDTLLYALLSACNVTSLLRVVAPAAAPAELLSSFHDPKYLVALQEPPTDDIDALDELGLVDDCPVFDGLWQYCSAVVGASLQGASMLMRGQADVAINWGGGRHHAKKAEAAGFCYVNDCVVAILHLLKKFRRVLYLDLDVHHPDGVESAFYTSDRVLCISVHKHCRGFYPGTGVASDTGAGAGKGFTLNLPLSKDGVGDVPFCRLVTEAVAAADHHFAPEALVLQCGADALAGDPLGGFGLTTAGLQRCVERVAALRRPLLLLGGGGYAPAAAARLWTVLTAAAVGPHAVAALPAEVPEHEHFPSYGPDFKLHTPPRPESSGRDGNAPEVVQQLVDRCREALRATTRRTAANGGKKPAPAAAVVPAAAAEVAAA